MSGYGMAASGAKLPFAKSNFTCDFRSRRPRCAQLVLGSARTQLSSHSGTWVSPAFTLVAQVDFGVSNLSKWLARSIGYPWQSRSAVEVGRYVVLSVRDTGEGMDAETLTRAIEPFFSTKGVGKGTELGLSMVFGLAQQSGGALRLESAPLSGTTARLWLPVASETAHPSGQTRNIVTQASGPAKILFVDDDLPIAGSTVDLPEDLGHQVIEVHSAIEALRLLDGGLAADLLITDHAMPGMTGIELAREVRRQYPQLPILLATGFAELEGSEVVDVARLAKPYTQLNLRRK